MTVATPTDRPYCCVTPRAVDVDTKYGGRFIVGRVKEDAVVADGDDPEHVLLRMHGPGLLTALKDLGFTDSDDRL